jgi:hypothetical protein
MQFCPGTDDFQVVFQEARFELLPGFKEVFILTDHPGTYKTIRTTD